MTVICALHLVASEAPQRIHSEISDVERFVLSGNVRPALAYAKDQGEVSGSLPLPMMTMHFTKSPSQQADLLQLLQLQQNRHSSQFHKWLTPEQFADRFGMSEKDLQKVTSWLETQGFSKIQVAHGRTFITFSGTAAQAQSAFHTSIHNYLTANGVTHYANATDPEFPKALNGIVEGIRGLHDFHPKPHLRSHFTSSFQPYHHYLTPNDWATIYDVQALYNTSINGTGRSIVIPGQTDLILSDIEAFETNSGLPVKDPQVIVAGVDPGIQYNSGDLGESDLDLEWAGGIAPGAQLIFVTSTDVTNSESYAVDNNVADVLSITYGDCEADVGATTMASLNSLFQQASVQGMSVLAAAGDQGAADCDDPSATYARLGLAVDVPGVSPYVTAVGGTEFNDGSAGGATQYWSGSNNSSNGSAISYIPEVGWNDTLPDGTLTSDPCLTTPSTSSCLSASSSGNTLAAGGGGASILNPKPAWQTGTGVPADGARDVPDFSVTASADQDGYLTCTQETLANASATTSTCTSGFRDVGNFLNVAGGTSAAAPSLAGVIALLDQKLNARQGLINPNLYTIASISSNAFHDITTGSNIVPCRAGTPNCNATTGSAYGTFGYSATAGYDQVTGWGSIDALNMVDQWNDDFKMTASPTTLTVNPGASGTATINVTPVGSFTGNVSFTCAISSGISNTTCSIPGTVSNGTGSVTLTVTAGSTAHTPWRPDDRLYPMTLLALLLTIGLCLARKQQRLQLAGFAFSLLLVVGLSSCGGGGSSTTSVSSGSGSGTTPTTPASVSGTVTITGTSGSLVNTITVGLTVP